jgi:ribosomal protein S17
MNKQKLINLEKDFYNEYLLKLSKVKKEYLETSYFKVGDFVEIHFESRDFGKEKVNAVINFIGIRHEGYLGFMYYFKKIKRDGKVSKFNLTLPKYSKILKLTLIKKATY